MVQSLHRHLARMEPVDLIMLDECHHAVSRTQLEIIDVETRAGLEPSGRAGGTVYDLLRGGAPAAAR